MQAFKWTFVAAFVVILYFGCAGPRITLFPSASDPLREVTLEGTADDKIQVIPITGFIFRYTQGAHGGNKAQCGPRSRVSICVWLKKTKRSRRFC